MVSNLAQATNADREKIAELIKDVRVCMLTTAEPDGTLRSRPMATQELDSKSFDGILWFFTEIDSGKVDEVQNERHVNLAYSKPSDQVYVSISGNARVVRDRDKAAELWKPFLKAWFPKGLDDPQLALLRVEATEAEYWEAPHGAVVRVVGLVKALVTGQKYTPGENKRMEV
jgi:general stress protein 26